MSKEQHSMHSTIAYILAAVAVVGALVSTIAAMPLMQAQNDTSTENQNQTTGGGEEPVIITTGNETTGPIALNETTEEPEPIPEPQTNVTGEEEEPQPIAVEGEGPFNITASQEPDEATIVVSLASLAGEGNVTVIEPDGNVTVVPDVNVTQVDNDTIVIAPPTENVTTIPENNVTVITPAPEPCACPAAGNVTSGEEPLTPVIVRPAPGQQVTIEGGEVTVQNETGVVVEGTENVTAPTEPEPEPAGNNNDTGLAPAATTASFDFSWMNPTKL